MADDAPWTVLRLLAWTADYFKQHGSDSPRLDAEVLLAHTLGCPRIALYTRFEEVPPEGARSAFKALVKRRAAGEPVAYVVGRREFYSLDFEVELGVLIPRPDTELLVVTALDRLKERGWSRPRLADVGVGSGAVAVAVAKHAPGVRVTAVDTSELALAVAGRNAARHGVDDRVELLRSDLFDAIPADARFELILSNPPYVTTAELAALEPTVRDHEPHAALDGGPEGTAVIERLLAAAPGRLVDGGELLLEVSPSIAERVKRLVEDSPALAYRETLKDLSGKPRVVAAVSDG